MRFAFVSLLLLGLLSVARAAEAEFIHVWPAWRDADSFDRINEYFGGSENRGRELALRTHAEAREGYYFLVRVKSGTAVPVAKFELSVIRPDKPETQTYTFATAVPAKEAVFQLGLTGADWPAGKKAEPVAWRIALLGTDGQVLAERKSFLWEKPAK
jgi:hypothetical protein